VKGGLIGLVLVLAVAAPLVLATPASATIDLAGPAGNLRVDGAASDAAGSSVAAAGDVNGDGAPDTIVGAPFAGNNGRQSSGSAYVIYGGRGSAPIDLQNLGAAGFRIDGATDFGEAGYSVAGAGDLNGDGLSDVIVGAPFTSNNGRSDSGSAYVIYGQATADPADVDLAQLTGAGTQTSRGMQIDGAAMSNQAGFSVGGAGDFNGDGRSDVLVGASGASFNGSGSGATYVIYGQAASDPADIDLAGITTRGMRIDGALAGDTSGSSVGGAGDVNGDGRSDVVIGAPSAHNTGVGSGSVYVVYGQAVADPADFALSASPSRSMRIDGAAAGDRAGESAASAGDANGDGVADIVIGARVAGNNGRLGSGSAYVVYGQASADPGDVALSQLTGAGTQTTRGMRIDGAAAGDGAGNSVAGTGDVNGDGHPDLVVGAYAADNNSRGSSGSAYVIFGQTAADPADLDLATITTTQAARGLEIDGAVGGDEAGFSVGGGGDVSGDGHPDVVIGADTASHNSRPSSGAAYLVDLTVPDTAIDSAPALTKDATPTFQFHASEPASFECSIDQGTAAFAPCSGPGATHTPALALRDGRYSFRVRASDGYGNVDGSPASRGFTIDTLAPQTKITKSPPKTLRLKGHKRKAKARFKFKSTEPGATFRCRLDKRTPKPCKSPTAYKLKKGKHAFSVAATDRAGNADASAAKFKLSVRKPKRHHRHP
jgi:hypothetical protein